MKTRTQKFVRACLCPGFYPALRALLLVACLAGMQAAVHEGGAAEETPPTLFFTEPPDGGSFLPTALGSFPPTTHIRFIARDDEPLEIEPGTFELELTDALTGEVLPLGAGGIAIRDDGREMEWGMAGMLEPNRVYRFSAKVTNSRGLSAQDSIYFDTFSPANPVIEIEDYNFDGGHFIDTPVLSPEDEDPPAASFRGKSGLPGVDFSITDPEMDVSPYRPDDPVATRRSPDHVRPKFVEAGGENALIFDYEVVNLEAGDWLVYTRTFAPGCYEVFLRQALENVEVSETVLEQLDQSGAEGSAFVLGRFLAEAEGGHYRNVPLTDSSGERVLIRVEGETTLRLRQTTVRPADANSYLNYIVFVPVAEDCIAVESAVEVMGPYEPVGVFVLNPARQSVRAPRGDSPARFFRLRFETDAAAPRIIDPRVDGDDFLMRYGSNDE